MFEIEIRGVLKKSDDEEKISLKFGDALADRLEEYEVVIKPGQLLTTLKLFKMLGFGQGLIYFWQSWVWEYQGMEVKLSKYTDDYYMWEIEARGNNAEKEVYQLADKLGLKPLSGDEYRKEIDYQCQNIFQLYSEENLQKVLQNF